MSTLDLYKYVKGEVYAAEKIPQPIPGTGIVNIVAPDGVTPIGYKSIKLYDDAVGTTELVLDTDFTIQEKDIEYSAKEGYDVYRSVQIINPAYQSAVFYADVDIVGAYTQYFPFPIGATYVQYATVEDSDPDVAMPEAESPEELYGGTWALLYDDEGIDFHTEGYDTTGDGASENRTNGLQLDNLQRITGTVGKTISASTADSSGAFTWTQLASNIYTGGGGGYNGNYTFDSANSPNARVSQTTAGRTTDRNRWMRLWLRTAL